MVARLYPQYAPPPGHFELDRNHGLTQGLVLAHCDFFRQQPNFNNVSPRGGFDLTGNYAQSQDKSSNHLDTVFDDELFNQRVMEYSGGGSDDGVSYGDLTNGIPGSDPLHLPINDKITIMAWGRYTSAAATNSNFPRIIACSGGANGANGWDFYFNETANNIIFVVDAGSGGDRHDGGTDLADGEVFCTTYVMESLSDGTFYHNGRFDANSTQTQKPFVSTDPGQPACVGNWCHSTDRQWAGTLPLILVWSGRALTASEVYYLYKQPFSIFRPTRRRRFFVPTAGGDVTVTPSAAAAVGAKTDPNIVLGSISLTPDVAAAVAANNGPTVVQGPITFTPDQLTAVGDTVAPVVVMGSLVITPAAAAGIGASVDPTILNSVELTPTPVSAVAGTIAPTVVLGSVTVTTDAATVRGLTTGPNVDDGTGSAITQWVVTPINQLVSRIRH